jgi:isovaleryl-CoA dehydrogenase
MFATLDDRPFSTAQRALREAVDIFAGRAHRGGPSRSAHNASPDGQARSLTEEVATMGWLDFGLDLDRPTGGGITELALVMEGLSEASAELSPVLTTMVASQAVNRQGSRTLVDSVLPRLSGGEVGSVAVSEEHAGSDVGSIRTSAASTATGWSITGEKQWCSNAGSAQHFLVLVRTGATSGLGGLSLLYVPAGEHGLTVDSMRIASGDDLGTLTFEGVGVDSQCILGIEGAGWPTLQEILSVEHVLVAARMLGLTKAMIGRAVFALEQRRQFGGALVERQLLRHRVADLYVETHAVMHMLFAACSSLDEPDGVGAVLSASMAKLKSSELAKRASIELLQILGGRGLVDPEALWLLHTALPSTIYGGTSEMQRDLIANEVIGWLP